MSNQNPPDPSRGQPDKIASSNSKVIVLSMKNLPSFKFDPAKNFLATNNSSESGQSIFSFKPQQLIQPAVSSVVGSQQKVQVIQSPAPVAVQKIGSPATILIRAQSMSTAAGQSQFASLTSCPNVKIQEAPVKVQTIVNKEISPSSTTNPPAFLAFRNKSTNEITVKSQVVPSLVLQQSTVGKATQSVFTSPVQVSSAVKGIAFTQSVTPTSQVPKLVATEILSPRAVNAKVQSVKPIPIRPKIDSQKTPLQNQVVVAAREQQPKTASITLPSGVQTFARFNAATQKWMVPGLTQIYPVPVPALTLIQPKPQKVEVQQIVSPVLQEEPEEEQKEEPEMLEIIEKTPEKPRRTSEEERILAVKRIIEGDQDEIEEEQPIVLDMSNEELQAMEEEQDEENGEDSVEEASVGNVIDSSSSMLLCDERIESVSTEVSPIDSEKSHELIATPADTDTEEAKAKPSPSVQDVRKNLERELSLEGDKENVEIAVDAGSESDESSMLDGQKLQDYEDKLMKSEIAKLGIDQVSPTITSSVQGKPKRVRKPKNPTIIATLGLPYKPSQPSNRKSKVEKKLEFELDFHDPLNKIQWDDGIGGLNNCNKLFGFDEFGLIEVLNKRDAMAKLKQLDVKDFKFKKNDASSFKLRKLVDPVDQFVCIVCSKSATIREFYSPECCSEACMAITKRKTSEMNTSAGKESSPESGILTPVDERKLMFGGELIPLQQLQQHLLEQQLPVTKHSRSKRRSILKPIESKFQWDTYLSSKSVPAPVELFKNPYPRTPNPFKVGMKLEALDPENQKMICVCTVEEKLGFRMKLHFDGYSPAYDFWVNADSSNIFPSGFCQSSNRVLQTPPKWSSKKFDWSEYLDHTNSIGAQRGMFPRLNKPVRNNQFELGMKLEVMRDGKLYAASIIDILEDRVLISHDGHEELGCIWMNIHSPYLHPCNFHSTLADPECFIPPWRPFEWNTYLKDTASKQAPGEFLFFRKRLPYEFVPGLKIEVVDRVNRQLIRPATVLCRNEFKIQVIYDGFDIGFAFWLDDDSEDIHPINWCEKTGHPIEHPAGFNKALDNGLCPSAGCRGIGNGVFSDRYFHDNLQECPYSKANWKKLLNINFGSHLDAKSILKRSLKQSKDISNGGRRDSIGNFIIKDKRDIKQEVNDVDAISMDINDETSSDVAKIPKKKGRKRKAPLVVEEEQELEDEKDEETMMKVAKTVIEDYGPQLNYSYQLWKKNSKVLDRASISEEFAVNPINWNVSKVGLFINKITNNPSTVAKFEEQGIDGAAFVGLCQDDLVNLMGIKTGSAIKIYNRILHLRKEIMLKFIKV